MKKLIFILISALFITTTAFAQSQPNKSTEESAQTPEPAIKKAKGNPNTSAPNNSSQTEEKATPVVKDHSATESKVPVEKEEKDAHTGADKPKNHPHPNGKNNHGMEMKEKNKEKQVEKKAEKQEKKAEKKEQKIK